MGGGVVRRAACGKRDFKPPDLGERRRLSGLYLPRRGTRAPVKPLREVLAAVVAFSSAATVCAVTGETPAQYGRWAVITSPEQSAGLADPAWIQLQQTGVELVERDQLDKIIAEIDLADLLDAEQHAGRRRRALIVVRRRQNVTL